MSVANSTSLYLVEKNSNKNSDNSKEIMDEHILEKSSNITQNDLWQSHNSLRDEQHRNEDRIARAIDSLENRLDLRFKSIDAKFDKIDAKFDKISDEIKSIEKKSFKKTDAYILALLGVIVLILIIKFMPSETTQILLQILDKVNSK